MTAGAPPTVAPALYTKAGRREMQRPQDGRRSNLALILQSLYDDPQLTRAELARQTGLTKVTVSDLVAELIDVGYVEETGMTTGTRPGKPAATLAVREDSTDIIALDLSAPDIFLGGVFSLRGTQRVEMSVNAEGRVGQDAVDAVIGLVKQCVEASENPVLGIGVGSPGTVDAAGMVVSAPNIGWSHLPLQDILAERFALPVAVQNDANAATIAEWFIRDEESSDSMIRVQISRGVGAGILLADALVLGNCAAAGEIGHVVIDREGALCSCGKKGCLETWISVPALRRRLKEDQGNRNEILAEAGRRLGMALAPIVAALDLSDVVLGGPMELLGGPFIEAAEGLIIERTESEFRRNSAVRLTGLGGEAVLLGAVSLVLRTTLGVS